MSVDDPILSFGALAGARRALEQATTLPRDAFVSPEVYEVEVERLFRREWLCAGHLDQVAAPGDYFTLDLLGEPLVVVRDGKGVVRVLSRACRHRAADVVRGAGNARSFQCPYHAWTYGLDGRLIGAPLMKAVTDFDREKCGLPEIRSEVWEGWIFVNFDPGAMPLGPRVAPLRRLLAAYGMDEAVSVETAEFESPFNWKVLVDNFMEAYHHIATHRDTLEGIYPAKLSNTPDNEGPYSVLFMPEPEGAEGMPPSGLPALGSLEPSEKRRLVAAVIYPFHLFAPSADALTWYQILPERFDRFTLRIYTCFRPEAVDGEAHRAAVHAMQELTKRVHHQDIEACEATWRGLQSRTFGHGRLCTLEKTIWQFNQWWAERMVGAV